MNESETQEIKIAAMISVPMCGWNPHWGCHSQALTPMQIQCFGAYGAWWDHGISNLMDEHFGNGMDWGITLDYDSMFTAAHVLKLMDTLAKNPHIDAIAPLQAKKVMPIEGVLYEAPILKPLNGASEFPVSEGPFEVEWAHFGLTIFRKDSFNRMCEYLRSRYDESHEDIQAIARVLNITPAQALGMARARFLQIPDHNGGYGFKTETQKINADIYFWRKWREAGNTVYIDPDVRIGHVEATVANFDEQMNVQHTHWVSWRRAERMKEQVAA